MMELLTDPVDHEIWYGAVPPLGITTAEPSLPPKHVTGLTVKDNEIGFGWINVTSNVSVHPLISETVSW